MVYRTDVIRLRDGAMAIDMMAEPRPETIEGLKARLQVVIAGALALQSLDDLGSQEANQSAEGDMLKLQKEGNEIRAKIKVIEEGEGQLVEPLVDYNPEHPRDPRWRPKGYPFK